MSLNSLRSILLDGMVFVVEVASIVIEDYTNIYIIQELDCLVELHYGENGNEDDGGNRKRFQGTGSVASVGGARKNTRTILALVTDILHKVTIVSKVLGGAIALGANST